VPEQKYGAPSVRQLAAVVERVAPRDPARWDGREKAPGAGGILVQVSEQRAKQLWMVVGMYDRAVGRSGEGRFPTRSAAELFQPQVLRRFWALAIAGGLRHWTKDVGKPLPVPTRRTVRDCLKILARLVVPGQQPELPVLEDAEPKPTVDPRQLTAVYRELVDLAGEGPLELDGRGIRAQERARLLAMVSVVLDTGARVGELERMNVDDLGPGLSEVRVVRRPQRAGKGYEEVAFRLGIAQSTVSKVMAGQDARASHQLAHDIRREVEEVQGAGPRVERYELSHAARVALRRWLDVRKSLVAEIEGGKSALWVTVIQSKAGPPGVRIRAQGLGQSYARGVQVLNWLMAGRPGWEPLPVRMEQLRRAVDPMPLENDEAGLSA
jgi:integrase